MNFFKKLLFSRHVRILVFFAFLYTFYNKQKEILPYLPTNIARLSQKYFLNLINFLDNAIYYPNYSSLLLLSLSLVLSVYLFTPVFFSFYKIKTRILKIKRKPTAPEDLRIKVYRRAFLLNVIIAFFFFNKTLKLYLTNSLIFESMYLLGVPFDFTFYSILFYLFGSFYFASLFNMPIVWNKKTFNNVWLMFVIFVILFFLSGVRNFYVLFFFVELLSFLVIILLMNSSDYLQHNWSVIQYFVFTCLSTTLFAFFLLKLSTYVPDLSYLNVFYYINNNSDYSVYYILGIIFILLFKIGFAPMHHILIDVYSNVPFYIFTFLVSIYKFMLFVLIIIIYYNIYLEKGQFFLNVISFFSIFFGSFGVVSAITLRRVLLFSSLFTSGVCLLLISLNFWYFAFFYFFLYSFFSMVVSMIFAAYEGFHNKILLYVEDLKKANSVFFVFPLIICLLVLMGLPPFPIFWLKMTLYSVALQAFGFYPVIFLIFLFTVVTYGYLKIIFFMIYTHYKYLGVPSGLYKNPGVIWHVFIRQHYYYVKNTPGFLLILFFYFFYGILEALYNINGMTIDLFQVDFFPYGDIVA